MSYEDWMRAISKNEGLFESNSDDEKSIEIKQNLRDIGLELEDLGYNPRYTRIIKPQGFVVLIYKHHHVNSIGCYDPLLTTDVKETILRMIDYMRGENYLYYLYIPRYYPRTSFEATEEIRIEDMNSIGYNSLRLEFRIGKTLFESNSKTLEST